ncbi:MAG TPA: hypothetical protein VES20_05670 [Bryobacteraceae bacterium]|nr:hypothetical protein [Bryobacteraceae bacterium]
MGCSLKWSIVALLAAVCTLPAQVIEFESNGLRYQTLTRDGLTLMIARLPAQVRDFTVLQIAVSNGGTRPQVLRPEDFVLVRPDGTTLPASSARSVIDTLMDRARKSDVIKLITTYENSIYGNLQYKGTNGYEARRQSALAEFTSTRVRAAAAASAIAFVPVKLAPGQSTDGAIFYPNSGKAFMEGRIRVRAAGSEFEFPLLPLVTVP